MSWVTFVLDMLSRLLGFLRRRRDQPHASLALAWHYPWVWIPGGRTTARRGLNMSITAGRGAELIVKAGHLEARPPGHWRWKKLEPLAELVAHLPPYEVAPSHTKEVQVYGSSVAEAVQESLGAVTEVAVRAVLMDPHGGKIRSAPLPVEVEELERTKLV